MFCLKIILTHDILHESLKSRLTSVLISVQIFEAFVAETRMLELHSPVQVRVVLLRKKYLSLHDSG